MSPSPVTLNVGDHAVEESFMVMALVTVNMSVTFCTFGSQMEPRKMPTPAVRLKLLSTDRQVLAGYTVTVTA